MKSNKKFIIALMAAIVSLLAVFWIMIDGLQPENSTDLLSSAVPAISSESLSDGKIKLSGENFIQTMPTQDDKQNPEQEDDEKTDGDEPKTIYSGESGENGSTDDDDHNAGGNDNSDYDSSDKNNDNGNNSNENLNPWEETFTDLPEDAYAQQTVSIENLMEEVGLNDKSRIIEVKCITGPTDENPVIDLINGVYSLVLSTKRTTDIRIRYIDDDGNYQTYIKKINYVRPEGSTPTEKQPLIQTNLVDMGIYNNPIINFDVWVTDYRGKTLAYNNMVVTVNGENADYVGEMDRQTYNTTLKNGTNEIKINITDEYQYTVTKTYTVYYKSGKGTITISLEGGTVGKKYFIEPVKMEVEPGVPLSYVLDKFLKDNGYEYEYTGSMDDGFYLSKVRKKNMIKGYEIPDKLKEYIYEDGLIFDENSYESLDCLGEFDFCQGSGWMYSINGLYSSYGFNKAFVQDGDVVRIRFTLAYGKDINGYVAVDGIYGRLKNYGQEW